MNPKLEKPIHDFDQKENEAYVNAYIYERCHGGDHDGCGLNW